MNLSSFTVTDNLHQLHTEIFLVDLEKKYILLDWEHICIFVLQ